MGRQLYSIEEDGPLLEALRGPDAPRRAPDPVVEAPLLDEGKESMLDDLGLTSEMKRQIRGAFTSGLIERVADSFPQRMALLEEQFDDVTLELVLDASTRAGIRTAYHTLPVGADREACNRSLTRWIDLSFAGFFADIMAALAKPGDLQSRRLFLPAVRAFRSASHRLLPGDRAIFTTYHRASAMKPTSSPPSSRASLMRMRAAWSTMRISTASWQQGSGTWQVKAPLVPAGTGQSCRDADERRDTPGPLIRISPPFPPSQAP